MHPRNHSEAQLNFDQHISVGNTTIRNGSEILETLVGWLVGMHRKSHPVEVAKCENKRGSLETTHFFKQLHCLKGNNCGMGKLNTPGNIHRQKEHKGKKECVWFSNTKFQKSCLKASFFML